MKASNKILIITLLLIVFVGASVHFTLYGRYKSGRITTDEQVKKELFDSHALPEFRHVRLEGLLNLRILTADKPRLEVSKRVKDQVHFEIQSDSLFVWGETAAYPASKRIYGPIEQDQETDLYLPPGISIEAASCIIQVSGSRDSAAAPDYQFHVSSTRLQFGEFTFLDSLPHYFRRVQIRAERQSEIRFTKNIDSLHAELFHSSLLDADGRLRHLDLQANDFSTVSLSGPDLQFILTGKNK